MRCVDRNKSEFSYCLYSDKIPYMDEDGHRTGEHIVVYKDPVIMSANVSAASGYAQTEQFGNLDNYDKVIVTDDMECPIDENTVLFVDKEPEFVEAETYAKVDDRIVLQVIQMPVYDYTVRRVAKSLNSISYALSKVDVS